MDDIRYETVTIPTSNPFVLTDYSIGKTPAVLKAGFYRPATLQPPYPAVVVSEGLGGVKTARERRYGRFLAQHGFAALVVDSFGARGYGSSPHPLRAINVTESMMLADAFACLVWLARHAEIDPQRIHNIGFSYGGMICLLTAYEQLARLFVTGPERFAGHVSYYGPTVPRLEDYATTGAPVAIMNGSLDDNFDEKRLELIAGDLKKGGSTVDNLVFDNAYHQWDSDDLERRFDRFNIRALSTLIDPANLIYDEKVGNRIWDIACGFPGLESQLPIMLTLVNNGLMPLTRYVAVSSANPARAFGTAVASGYWYQHYIYWFGPAAGALGGLTLSEFLFKK